MYKKSILTKYFSLWFWAIRFPITVGNVQIFLEIYMLAYNGVYIVPYIYIVFPNMKGKLTQVTQRPYPGL